MTHLRMALLTTCSIITVAGGILLLPEKADAFVCANTYCYDPGTCKYSPGSQCTLGKVLNEIDMCVRDVCPT
jgi:hypothetical protein